VTLKSCINLRIWHIFLVALFAGFSVGCSGVQKVKPAELGLDTQLIGVRPAWSNGVGAVNFPLQVKVVGNQIYVASSGGILAAIDGRTGQDIWRLSLGETLSAGVGSDGEYAAVATNGNQIITASAGRELWRQKISAVTLTAPLVAGGRVFVLSTDRSVSSFDAQTGRRLWRQQRDGDSLVLGQSGTIIAVGDTLIVGLGGRLVAMSPENGSVRWDLAIGNSRGTNEIERLVDVVSGVSRFENQICVRSFQSAVGCVDAVKGRLLWSKPASGFMGLDGDDTLVVGTESDGGIQAWRRSDGERVWNSDRLKYRKLSGPLVAGRSVVIGDNSGNLHFLSKIDGEPLTRKPTDGTAIVVAPILVGQTVVAVTHDGGIFGFKPE
jgi:outer membrane protein assembly factor BamB